jgi:hypothetical protein
MEFIIVSNIVRKSNAFLSEGASFTNPTVVAFPFLNDEGEGHTGLAIVDGEEVDNFNDIFGKMQDPSCATEDDYKELLAQMPQRVWCGSLNRPTVLTLKDGTTEIRMMKGTFCDAVRTELNGARETEAAELQTAIDNVLADNHTNTIVVNQEKTTDNKGVFARSSNGRLYPVWTLNLGEQTQPAPQQPAPRRGRGRRNG